MPKLTNPSEVLAAISEAFGSSPFNDMDLINKARTDERLAAAIDAATPRARCKDGSFKHGKIREVLNQLRRHFLVSDGRRYRPTIH
jgi:hypothetical protein